MSDLLALLLGLPFVVIVAMAIFLWAFTENKHPVLVCVV